MGGWEKGLSPQNTSGVNSVASESNTTEDISIFRRDKTEKK